MSTNIQTVLGAVIGGNTCDNKRISMTGTMLAIAIAIAIVETVTGLNIDNKGMITVNDTDMMYLKESIDSGDRSDRVSTDWFKAEVPKGGAGYYTGLTPANLSYHHIIPYNQVKRLASRWTEEAQVKKYINLQHIRDVLIRKNILQRKLKNQARAVHSAIAWNPHNLVYGPNPELRCNDPGPDVDTELLGKQSPGFRTAANRFIHSATAQNYGTLPATVAVRFLKSGTCYHV